MNTPDNAPKKILVVVNEESDPILLVGDWLAKHNVELDVVEAFAGDEVPASVPQGVDGLIVLGGAMGANDDADHQWLTPERALLKDAVDIDLPVFGICLGAQMLATAIGGTVDRAPVAEVGLYAFDVASSAAGDPVFGHLAGQTVRASQWHQDYIAALPQSATVLASNADVPVQAFKTASAYGVQFHPEVDDVMFKSWAGVADEALVASGRSVDEACTEIVEAQAELVSTWEPVFDAWAQLIAQRPTR